MRQLKALWPSNQIPIAYARTYYRAIGVTPNVAEAYQSNSALDPGTSKFSQALTRSFEVELFDQQGETIAGRTKVLS